MKVVFLTEYYHPFEVGGAERSAERLARELARAGTPVTIVTPNYGAPARETRDGVEVLRLPFPQRLVPGQLARRAWLANPLLQGIYAVRLRRVLRDAGASLLHVQNTGLLPAGIAAGRLARRPVVVTVRDLGYLPPGATEMEPGMPRRTRLKWRLDAWWARAERRVRRRALRRAARVIFVSRGLADVYAEAGLGEITAKAAVVHNIGPESPPPGPAGSRESGLVLFVGKLSRGKGLQILYAAAARVARRRPGVRFVLAGMPGVGFEPPPPEIADVVTLAGRLSSEAVADLMRRAAILVAPAIWPEPLSRVLLEAMAAGLPIVATTVGGNLEALEPGRSALLVPPGDPAALEAALLELLADPGAGGRLAAAARERFDRSFSPAGVLPQVMAVYDDACRGR